MKYEGGYLVIKKPLVRTGSFKHTADDGNADAVSPLMMRAVSAIQDVPWRINTFILDVMREAFVNGDTIGDLPPADDIPLPDKLPLSVWGQMSVDQKIEHKGKLADIHGTNARTVAKRESALRKLKVAEELRDEDAIWFPHSLDFRGRIYPLPQDINPQGDDLSKALLMFAEGKPVTERGVWWLAIAVANAFGHDKLTFEERFDWTVSNVDAIVDSADRPLTGRRFWTTADEPWVALALCREFIEAWTQGPDYISHTPVHLDGSCNGLQHLSAWGLDPIGAKATNLTRGDTKEDLYSEVAKVVEHIVQRDAATLEEAAVWVGRVTRRTVKRAVMTTPYGVTPRGIQNQVIADRLVSDMEGSPVKNAGYIRDAILEALASTVKSAKETMGYIQGCAIALAKAKQPLKWETPGGMRIMQAYKKKSLTRLNVKTLFGELHIWKDDDHQGFDLRKQTLASAPNVIHSYDAAHLAKTVINCLDNHRITAFAFVHDSYGCHAANVDAMRSALLEEFVAMYQTDPIDTFEAGIRAYAPDVKLPPRPQRGNFNIEEVKTARYFFS